MYLLNQGGPMLRSFICLLIHLLFPPNKSMLGACLSLFRFTLSQKVGFPLISFTGPPIDTLRMKPPPRLHSEHTFCSFPSLYREKSAFARCRGFIPTEKAQYREPCISKSTVPI